VSIGESFFVTSEYRLAVKFAQGVLGELNYDTFSYQGFITQGYVSPGHTIYREVHAASPWECISFENGKIHKTPKVKNKISSDICEPADYYSLFYDSVQKIIKTSNITRINLTGGMDTRLILSTLTSQQRKYMEFVFDQHDGNPINTPYDKSVVLELAQKFDLNVSYSAPLSPYSPIGHDSEYSFYNRLLTGMYGGETLGANSFNCLPKNRDECLVDERFDDYKNNVLKIKLRMREHVGSDHDLYYYCYVMTQSTMSRIYNDKVWICPVNLFRKKISPFMNIEFLTPLFRMPLEDINNYKFYYRIYDKCLPEMLEIPFHSSITSFNYPKIVEMKTKSIIGRNDGTGRENKIFVGNQKEIDEINSLLRLSLEDEISYFENN
jgi:hypothetical protein